MYKDYFDVQNNVFKKIYMYDAKPVCHIANCK
jgi:hypothetical protein